MAHLSVRLAWHDHGWDGCVCQQPHLNSSCIVIDTIREAKDNERERAVAGKKFAEVQGQLPPCCWTSNAFSPHSFTYIHNDPLHRNFLSGTTQVVPAYSCLPAPYRWLREENFREIIESENLDIPELPQGVKREYGWVYEPDRQELLLKNFWGKVMEDADNLVFYYVKSVNPVDENSMRMIVGVSRLKEIGPQIYFTGADENGKHYPVWARTVTQKYPDEGFLLPYQDYIKLGLDPKPFACEVPHSSLPEFLFVAEHVSDDSAVGVLEKLIQSVDFVINDNKIEGDWRSRLRWLNDCLAEVWKNRGPYPGIGSVLQYLGCDLGTSLQRTVLKQKINEGINPLAYTVDILEGRVEPGDRYRNPINNARHKWEALQTNPKKRELLELLARFELTTDQVRRISDWEQRKECGLDTTDEQLLENPYLIAELDLGTEKSDPISLETIDRGLIPEGEFKHFIPEEGKFLKDDKRRVRGIAVNVLKTQSEEGDTILTFSELLTKVRGYFPDNRACLTEMDFFLHDLAFYQHQLWFDLDSNPKLVSLNHLRENEDIIKSAALSRAGRPNLTLAEINWREKLIAEFGEPKTEREKAAVKEKEIALQKLYSQKLSILTGGAGTGKTSALKIFLDALFENNELQEGKLLLAPTGKARVRLSSITRQKSFTIHQLLHKLNWYMPGVFKLKHEGGDIENAGTIIIDECSMVSTDLFGTLLKAIDLNMTKRLILVGDPNQLPPIGPGRPFVDIVEWMRQNHPESIAELKTTMRVNPGGEGKDESSAALSFADGYRRDNTSPGDDEYLSLLAQKKITGDLEVYFWDDHDQLVGILNKCMEQQLGIQNGDYVSFNNSLGISDAPYQQDNWHGVENWQILSPMRSNAFGTEEINRLIQFSYRKSLIDLGQNPWGRWPRPFGDNQIVYTDKVIQLVNQRRKAYPPNTEAFNYVANGEIGVAIRAMKNKKGDYLHIGYSTQDGFNYTYFRNQVDGTLELAYALTVHKAQGSDFDLVFLIIPQNAQTLSRELIYTGLTRFRKKLILLIEKDITALQRLRNPSESDTQKRNTFLFEISLRPDEVNRIYPQALIHRTKTGIAVRSKSEVIVADILTDLGVSYDYEKPLVSKANKFDFRLPDFTIGYQGDYYFWEHLGLLHLPTYKQEWERKKKWYQDTFGYAIVGDGGLNKAVGELNSPFVITSSDGKDGSIDAQHIENLVKKYILNL